MYRKLIKYSALFGIGIFVVNALAHKFYWYTSIFGFDKVMHALGGVFTAFVVAAILWRRLERIADKEKIITILLCAFIVGLVWEYYEYVVQMYVKYVHIADVPDSIGDLIFDMFGATFGVGFVILLQKRYNR